MATKHSTRKTSGPASAGRKSVGSAKAATPRTSSSRASTSATAGSRRAGAEAPAKRGSPAAPRSAKSATASGAGSRGRKSTAARRAPAAPRDALALLRQDHDAVDQMFKKYERMKSGDARKIALREQILEALTVHAQVEEELFYPALRSLFEAGDREKAVELIDEADVEHGTLKWLIEQLEGGDQREEGMTDARVKVLGEYVKHHVQEEEEQIFKAARKVDIDLAELGRQLEARKRQLRGEERAQSEAEGDGAKIGEPAQMASAASES